jgi:hypothetical protein
MYRFTLHIATLRLCLEILEVRMNFFLIFRFWGPVMSVWMLIRIRNPDPDLMTQLNPIRIQS